ncbi:MAG TPA: rhodanese-like domain-containing protein [Oceanospirillaceae bacterium]|nr:rhodanese-like domain-containing protein [Oceanospirillaceae bacterium]
MAYTEKFQTMSDQAMARVEAVNPNQVDALVASGAILLDIRDQEEHNKDHISGSLNVSRGKLEMNIEGIIPDLNSTIICYCNANNRGALSAASLRDMGYNQAMFIKGGRLAYRALSQAS